AGRFKIAMKHEPKIRADQNRVAPLPWAASPGLVLMPLLLTSLGFLPQNVAGHEIINHQTIMDYAGSKAAALPTPLNFSATQSTRMHEGAGDEDSGSRSLNHAYNPMTGGTF